MNSRWHRRRSMRRGASSGMTLVEIMIVVIIMALIATGVAFAVLPMLADARVTQTSTDMRTIHGAVTLYIVHHGNCPESVGDLIDDGRLSANARSTDAWDNEFTIICEGNEPVIVSNGPDEQPNTEDDIRTDQAESEE